MNKHLLTIGCAFAASLTSAHTASALPYDSSYCREFTRPVNVGGQLENAYGTACLQPDGSWKIVGDDRYDGSPAIQHVTVINRNIDPIPVYIPKQHYFTAREVAAFHVGTSYRSKPSYDRRHRNHDRRGRGNHHNHNRWR